MKHIHFLVCAILLLISGRLTAQQGSLDGSFADHGMGIYHIPLDNQSAESEFSVMQPDGKIIMGGFLNNSYIYLTRLNTNGTFDNSYGGDGKILFTTDGLSSRYLCGAMQADGKLVIGATAASHFLILRFNMNGTADNSFDADGKATIAVDAASDFAKAIAIQPDNKIVIAGMSGIAENYYYSVLRLNSNGSLDNSFDADGKTFFTVSPAGYDEAAAITINSGKMILTGYSRNTGDFDFSVVRLNNDGSMDAGFDGDGKLLLPVQPGSDDRPTDIAVNGNNKILICGYSEDATEDFIVVRLNTDGSIDDGFDVDGKAIIHVSDDRDYAYRLVVQPDNKVLVAGNTTLVSRDVDYSIVRINNNGTLDNNFDGDGIKIFTIMANGNDRCTGLQLLPNGEILITGNSYSNVVDVAEYYNYSAALLNSNGNFDNSFDSDGKLLIDPGTIDDAANAVIIQANGFIVTAGKSFYSEYRTYSPFLRVKKNGNTDNNFDGDGKAALYTLSAYEANGIAIQADGKIVAACTGTDGADTTFSVSRLNADGSPDVGFGSSGIKKIDITTYFSTATCVAIQADGKIVAAGYAKNGFGTASMAAVRLNTDGSLDNSFDVDGIKTVGIELGAFAYAIAIQADGKIVLGGYSKSVSKVFVYDFAAVRLNTNGSLDNTFSGDGRATVAINGDDFCYAMKLTGSGDIVLAGSSKNGSANVFSVMELNSVGVLQPNFGNGGKRLISIGATYDVVKGIAIQPNGSILLGGYSFNGTDYDAAIVKLTSKGKPDNSFDGDGKSVINLAGSDEVVNAIAMQDDGDIILAGRQKTTNESRSNSIMLMRIKNNAVLEAIITTTKSINNTGALLTIPSLLHRNEQWHIQGAEKITSVTVTNTIGQTVFKSKNYRNSLYAAAYTKGMYYYIITVHDAENKEHLYKGKLLVTD